jgi:hypothetical protein
MIWKTAGTGFGRRNDMKNLSVTNKLYLYLVMLVLLAMGAWTARAQGQTTNPVRQAWEYKIIDDQANMMRVMNQLGADGWELVTISPSHNTYLFKRPK